MQSQLQALAIGGYRGPPTAIELNLKEWNGSAWTEIADINNERMDLGSVVDLTQIVLFLEELMDHPQLQPSNTEFWDGTLGQK